MVDQKEGENGVDNAQEQNHCDDAEERLLITIREQRPLSVGVPPSTFSPPAREETSTIERALPAPVHP
jgi:hypothetical protein